MESNNISGILSNSQLKKLNTKRLLLYYRKLIAIVSNLARCDCGCKEPYWDIHDKDSEKGKDRYNEYIKYKNHKIQVKKILDKRENI